MDMDKEKERLMGAFILEEFGDELTKELKERYGKSDKTPEDYLFLFFNSRKKTLFSFQNLLWKEFLRNQPDFTDLSIVAQYIPNLSERALFVIFKNHMKETKYLRGYVLDLEIILKKFAIRQNIDFEARNILLDTADNTTITIHSAVARQRFEGAPIKNEKRLNRRKKDNGKRAQIKQLIRRERNARHKSSFYSSVSSDLCRTA